MVSLECRACDHYVRCAWCDWWAWDPFIIDSVGDGARCDGGHGWIGRPLCDVCFDWHSGELPFLELRIAAEASPYEPTAITRAATLLSRWMPKLQHSHARVVAEYLISPYDP